MYIKRRVYSEVNGEYVPVNEVESLYSVTMTEDELRLFTEAAKEWNEPTKEERKRLHKEKVKEKALKKSLERAHGKRIEGVDDKFIHENSRDSDREELYETGHYPSSRILKEAAKAGSLGAIGGALLGSGKGALIGAASGAALSVGANKLAEHLVRKSLRKDPESYDADKTYLRYKHGKATRDEVEKAISKSVKKHLDNEANRKRKKGEN